MNHPLVSIIIPVYRVEHYLHRCIDSVLAQTLKEIEVILIDDGSPDMCPQICDEYAQRDARVKVVHKENGGSSAARNTGIRMANGEYIGFVDSDDYIAPWMYETMLENVRKFDVDFVMVDYVRVRGEVSSPRTTILTSGLYDKSMIHDKVFPQLIMGENLDYGPLLAVWHCLYRKQFIDRHSLYFEENISCTEDAIFSAIVGYCANSFYYMKNSTPYFHRENANTLSTSHKLDAWDIYLRGKKRMYGFFHDTADYDFSRQLKLYVIYHACNALSKLSLMHMPFLQRYHEIKRIVCSDTLSDAFRGLQLPVLPWKFRLTLVCLKCKQVWLMALRGHMEANKL